MFEPMEEGNHQMQINETNDLPVLIANLRRLAKSNLIHNAEIEEQWKQLLDQIIEVEALMYIEGRRQ